MSVTGYLAEVLLLEIAAVHMDGDDLYSKQGKCHVNIGNKEVGGRTQVGTRGSYSDG